MRVAINGAGVEGPTLAYWLRRFGHEPVLFEKAPRLRMGGYLIDFWGLGYDIAERMGLANDINRIPGLELDHQARIDARFPDSPVQTECGPGGTAPLVESIKHQDLHQIQKLLILVAKVPTSQLRTSCLGIW